MKSINKNFSSESIQIGIQTSTVILNNDQNDLLIEIPLITTNILNNLDFSIVYSYMNRFSNYAFLGMGVKHNYYTKIVKKPTTDNNIYKVELQDGRVATFEEKDDEYYSEDFNMHINKTEEKLELIDSMGNMLLFKLDENYPYMLTTSKNVEYYMKTIILQDLNLRKTMKQKATYI